MLAAHHVLPLNHPHIVYLIPLDPPHTVLLVPGQLLVTVLYSQM